MSGYEPLQTSDINEEIPTPFATDRRERHVVFAIDDDEEDDLPLSQSRYVDDERSPKPRDNDVPASRVAPALRSTLRSREAGWSYW